MDAPSNGVVIKDIVGLDVTPQPSTMNGAIRPAAGPKILSMSAAVGIMNVDNAGLAPEVVLSKSIIIFVLSYLTFY